MDDLITKDRLKHIYLISDTELFPKAERFIDKFLKDNDPISSTQINGLENIVSATHSVEKVAEYIRRQHEKAAKHAQSSRKDRYVANFYQALGQEVKRLAAYVKEHQEMFPILDDTSKKERKEFIKVYQYYLVKEFVQHLTADHNFHARQH